MMDWNQLLMPVKYGDKSPRIYNEYRSVFEQDYDRIIFSTSFRRLQDKTQVIPLPEHDFVHNRLTHSIEVSSVARTLGKTVGSMLLKKYAEINISAHDFGHIVSAAALAHDIGNPPFGHSGEAAIGHYFMHGNGAHLKDKLTPQQYNDLIFFEGNANGFLYLSNNAENAGNGLRLSYPTLAAYTKYPRASFLSVQHEGKSFKKFGFFTNETHFFNDISNTLGLIKVEPNCYLRHPLAFLVEAADDICYHIIDFEDGIRLGYVNFKEAEELLFAIAENDIKLNAYQSLSYTEKTAYLRAVCINKLVQETANCFMLVEPNILEGKFNKALIDESKYAKALKEIVKLSVKQIYKHPDVLAIEAAGFEILGGLLHAFLHASEYYYEKSLGSTQSNRHLEKIGELLPAWVLQNNQTNYNRAIGVSSYVASLTDKHAIRLFKTLKGTDLLV